LQLSLRAPSLGVTPLSPQAQDDGLTDTSNDVTSLTFQFRTESVANLNFNYIFASEEYNEFVNSFNDIFAFLLTPDTNAANDQHDAGNTYNIATIPNTTAGSTTGAVSGFISNGSVVSIDNVNIGDSNDGAAATPVNPSLFVNNDVNATDPNFVPTDPENHQFDGRTVSLTAEFENLPAGIHEITLIVADANDSLLDSAVFLEQDTFFIIPNSPIPFAIEPILEAGMHASFRDLNSRLLRARSAFEQAGREIYKEGDGSSLIQSSTYNSRFQVFGSGHFYNTDVPGFDGLTTSVPELEIDLAGGTVGLEYALTNFLRVGAGYIHNSGDFQLGSFESLDAEFNSFAIYGSFYQPITQSVHLHTDLLYGKVDGEISSSRDFEEFGNTNGSGDTEGDYFEANLGLNFHNNIVTHGPLLRYIHSENEIDEIVETGFAAQTYPAQSIENRKLRAGYQGTYHHPLSLSDFSLQGRIFYEKEFEDDARLIDGISHSPDDNAIIGGLAALWNFEGGGFVTADWEGRFADQGDSHHISFRAGFAF